MLLTVIFTYHIIRYFEPWEVLCVLVLLVDDFCEFPASHDLLIHPHLYFIVEDGILLHIHPHYPCNG